VGGHRQREPRAPGEDVEPDDVDVLCDETGAYTIEAAFSDCAVELVSYREARGASVASTSN